MTITEEEVSRLERYVEAARELVDLKDDLAECLETLKELQPLKLPTASEIQSATEHLATLQAIEELAEV